MDDTQVAADDDNDDEDGCESPKDQLNEEMITS